MKKCIIIWALKNLLTDRSDQGVQCIGRDCSCWRTEASGCRGWCGLAGEPTLPEDFIHLPGQPEPEPTPEPKRNRGVSNYRVEGRQVKCLKLADDDWL